MNGGSGESEDNNALSENSIVKKKKSYQIQIEYENH